MVKSTDFGARLDFYLGSSLLHGLFGKFLNFFKLGFKLGLNNS